MLYLQGAVSIQPAGIVAKQRVCLDNRLYRFDTVQGLFQRRKNIIGIEQSKFLEGLREKVLAVGP